MFYAENLTKQSIQEGLPWLVPIGDIPHEVRDDHEARQAWYKSPSTKHVFYTGYEGVNPLARVTGKNPPKFAHASVLDVDHKFSETEIRNIIRDRCKIWKPRWLDRSLGGKWHLIWMISAPVAWPYDPSISEAVNEKLLAMLGMKDVLDVDAKAFYNCCQLYCSGGVFIELEDSTPISAKDVDNLIYNTSIEVCRRTKAASVDLARVFELIKTKFPSLEWPGEFVEGASGPTFWIPESTSTNSAIVHGNGLFTFSAHAERKVYSWDEILGPGAIQRDSQQRIAKAAENYYTDGLGYFQPRNEGGFKLVKPEALRRMLVSKGLSSRARKGEDQSEVDQALHLIDTQNDVDSAAPFLFTKPGPVRFNGQRYLNTLESHPIEPAPDLTPWGKEGRFPFLSDLLGRMFLSQEALDHYISWLHWFYRPALDGKPTQGQSVYMMGGPSLGKTLINRRFVGPLVGGFFDCTRFLMSNDQFGGHLFEFPFWCVDDQTMTGGIEDLARFTSNLKKMIANKTFEYHMKYQKPSNIEWAGGRIGVTGNLDGRALGILPAMEDTIADKVNLYRLISNRIDDPPHLRLPDGFFSSDVENIIDSEIRYAATYIYHWKIPKAFLGDQRFGIKAYHDPILCQAAFANSGSSNFVEVVSLFMGYHCNTLKTDHLTGTAAEILAHMQGLEHVRYMIRNWSAQSLSRNLIHLESVRHSAISSVINEQGMRVWTINWKDRI